MKAKILLQTHPDYDHDAIARWDALYRGGSAWRATTALSALKSEVDYRSSLADKAEAEQEAEQARNPDFVRKPLPPEIPMIHS